MMFYGVLGTVLGGRLGYAVLQGRFYFSHPLDVFKVWKAACRSTAARRDARDDAVRVAAQAPLAAGHRLRRADGADEPRPGGSATSSTVSLGPRDRSFGTVGDAVPGRDARRCGMVAEASGLVEKWHLADVFMQYQMLPRHPSQLYEIALEGIALFFALFFFARKSRADGRRVRAVPDRLRPRTLHGRVRARRRLPRPARARPVDGAVAVAADDPRGRRADGLGVSAARRMPLRCDIDARAIGACIGTLQVAKRRPRRRFHFGLPCAALRVTSSARSR